LKISFFAVLCHADDKLISSIVVVALLVFATADIDSDVVDTDAIPNFDPITTGNLDGIPDFGFMEEGCFVDLTNETLVDEVVVDNTDWENLRVSSQEVAKRQASPELQKLGDIGFAISVEDITRAIQGGGSNPIEKLIISKVVQVFNQAGVTVRGGSLVYQLTNGPRIELSGGCSDSWLDGGWRAQATLLPATNIKVTMGFDGMTLTIKTTLNADTTFGMSGHVKARIGKKVLGKCIRISKGVGISSGAHMSLSIESQLSIGPSLVNRDGKWYIGLNPQIWVSGDLTRFDPTSSASVKIFGIHIRSIEKKIQEGIKAALRAQVTPGKVQEQLTKLQEALQAELTRVFAGIVFPLPGLSGNLVPQLQGAVTNIKNHQF